MNYTVKVGSIEVERRSCSVHYLAWIVLDGNEFGNDYAMSDNNRKVCSKNGAFSFKAGVGVTDAWLADKIEKAVDCDKDSLGRTRLNMNGYYIVVVKN